MKLKQWQSIFHVIVNVNSIVQHEISRTCEEHYSWNPSTWI